jgi:phage terminase large subunit-like protein
MSEQGRQDIVSLMQPHGQGYRDMSPSIEAVEDALVKGQIRHGMHPILTWCVSNTTTIKDPAGLRKFDKTADYARIDGAQALAMAFRHFTGGVGGEDLSGFLAG